MQVVDSNVADAGALTGPRGGPRLADYLRFLTWRRLAKLAYGVVVFVIVTEVSLALFRPRPEVFDGDLITKDANLGFRMVPQYGPNAQADGTVVATNSWGLRERELGPPPADAVRVLILGDSIVFGLGVAEEDTFPRKVERVLAERLERPVQVVNGGVPGWGTLQALRFFEEKADDIQPDVVLLTVSVINDVADNLKFVRPDKRWQTAPTGVYRFFLWLRQRSQIYMMIRRQRFAITGEQMMQVHAKEPSPSTERGLVLTEQSLADFAAAARERGMTFGVVIAPAQRQASPREWAEIMRYHRLDQAAYAVDEPNRRLAHFADAAGMPLLDLLPVLQQHTPVYENEHWTEAGNALVARTIGEFLIEQGVLPGGHGTLRDG